MVKKLIAGALSGTLFLSAVMTEGLFSLPEIGQQAQTMSDVNEKNDLSITSTNSLGNYIARASAESDANRASYAKALASNKEEKYLITNLEFDEKSGQLRAASSQTTDCFIVFSFVDEETGNVRQSIKQNVRKCAYDDETVVSEAKADLSDLPEYYIVQAQLVNENGTSLSNTYKYSYYTKNMREIIATDINDFEESQVVNFDESEDTNFLVLNEDTVKAESSEEVNNLISADYDTNTYVIDNIDESIANLESGQYFYMQPNEEDIIAVAVEDVQIEGDTATIKGNDKIDDMFDFIKIETTCDTDDAVVDMSDTSENVELVETPEDNSEYSFNVNGQTKKRLSGSSTASDTFSGSLSRKFNDHFSVEAKVSCSFKNEFNFYKTWGYCNTQEILDITLKFTATATATTKKSLDDELVVPVTLDTEDEELKEKLAGVTFPIPSVPGLGIDLEVDFCVKISASYTLSASRSFRKGFIYDSDTGCEDVSVDTDISEVSQKLEGKIFVGFEFKFGISFGIGEVVKIIKAGITFTIGIEATGRLQQSYKFNNKTGEVTSSCNVFCKDDMSSIYTHACNLCIEGDIQFVCKVGVYFSIGVKVGKAKAMLEYSKDLLSKSIKIADWYCSFQEDGAHPGWGKCPNLAYKTEFNFDLKCGKNVIDTGVPSIEVKVDGQMFAANGTQLSIYCKPNTTHFYEVYVNGEFKTTGRYLQINAKKTLTIPLTFSADDEGNVSITPDTQSSNDGEAITTTTYVKPVYTTGTTQTNPPIQTEHLSSEYIELGPAIIGQLYGDGSVWIYGHGDMYDFSSSPFVHPEKIKYVEMQDDSPDTGMVITGIGSHVFSGAKNLETIYTSHNIKRIGSYAFSGCSKLKYFRFDGEKDESTKFELPHGLTSLGEYAFSGCGMTVINEDTFPAGITSTSIYLFANCNSLQSVTIPDSIKKIGNYTFSGCKILQKAVISEGVENIGDRVFESCVMLSDLTLPYAGLSLDDIKENKRPIYSNLFNYYVPDGTYSATNSAYHGIPASLTKITITGGDTVPKSAFYGISSLITINLPDTVTSIQESAFENCSSMPFIYFPKELETIGDKAFMNSGIRQFTAANFPSTLTSIGSYGFAECKALTEVTIPGTVKTLGDHLFEGCPKLDTLVIKNGVSSIGERTLENCFAIRAITLPYAGFSIKDTEENTRPLSYNMFNYYVPKGTYSATDSAYHGIPSTLRSITITGGTRIPDDAFHGMKSLDTITIPDTVTEIGNYSCYGCAGVLSVKLPVKLEKIGDHSFDGCTSMKLLSLPKTLTSTGSYAFANCGFTAIIPTMFSDTDINLGSYVFANNQKLTSVIIPSTVKSLGSNSFSNCPKLVSAEIQEGVESIGERSFESCISLESLILPFAGLSAADIEKDEKPIQSFLFNYYVPSGTYSATSSAYHGIPATLKTIVITGGTKVPESAFYGMKTLTTVKLPDSVTSIGAKAFEGCLGIKSIALPKSLEKLGDRAFANCGFETIGTDIFNSKSIDFGSGVFAQNASLVSAKLPGIINNNAGLTFSGCSNLKTVEFEEGTGCIGERSLENCLALEELILPYAAISPADMKGNTRPLSNSLFNYYVPKGTYSATNSAYHGIPSTLNSITITGGTRIPNNAFDGMQSVTSISIPETVTEIGDYSFNGCAGITAVKLPSKLKSIGDHGFNGCKGITTITLPASLVSAGSYAFADCGFVKIVPDYFSKTNITLGSYVFANNQQLTSAVIPSTVKSLGSSSFSNCQKLVSAEIKEGVESIGERSFESCISLESLILPYAGLNATDIEKDQNPIQSFLFNFYVPSGTYSATSSAYHGIPATLKSITITGGSKIPASAFYGMKTLTTVKLPDSITSIGANAFEGCSGIKSIALPESLEKIGDRAFAGCGFETVDPDMFNSESIDLGSGVFAQNTSLVSAKLPAIIKSNAGLTFSGCTILKKVEFEEGIGSIGERSLESCVALEELILPYAGISPADIQKNQKPLQSFLFNYYVPSGTYSATSSAYHGIPSNLKSITITGGSKIPDSTFYGMKSLTTIKLPDSVTSIGAKAFEGCLGIKSLSLPKSLENAGDRAFANCGFTSVTPAMFSDKAITLGNYVFADNKNLTSVVLPSTVKSLGSNSFSNCQKLVSAEIKEGIESIGERPFENCFALESLTLPYAGLSATDIKKDQKPIYSSFFNYYVPDGTYSATNSAYHGIPATLKSITITGGTKIPESAFYGMKNVKVFTLPSTLTSVGNSAYHGCNSFEELNITGGKIDWDKVSIGTDNEPLLKLINKTPTTTTAASTTTTTKAATTTTKAATTTTTKATTTTTKAATTTTKAATTTTKATTTTTKAATTTTKATTTTTKVTTTTTKATTTTTKAATTTTKAATTTTKATTTTTKATTTTTKATTTTTKATTTTTKATTTTTKAATTTTKATTTTTKATTTTTKATTTTTKATTTTTKATTTTTKAATTTTSSATTTQTTEKPEVVQTVKLGDDITGTVYSDGTAYISGEGSMYDKQSSPFEAPESIEKVYMTGNISNIGDSTFADMSSLSSIVIPDSVESIGNNAFSGCTGLESVGYSGSEQAWNNVWIGEGNEALGNVQFNVKPQTPARPGLIVLVLKGDSNGDGKISKADGMLLARYIAGWEGIVIDLDSADINNDGKISKADGMILSRYIAGWEGYDKYFS